MAQPRSTGRSRTLVRAWATLAATALLGAGAAAGPAVASVPATDLDYQGTALNTSTELQGAPQVPSGVYVVDAPGVGETGYLEVPRSIGDGSNIWVGATVDLGLPATAPGFDGGLQVSGYADGVLSRDCWSLESSVSTSTADGGQSPRLETKLWQTNREPVCRSAAAIVIAMHSYKWAPPAGTKVQLTIWEEPPVTGTEGLQAPSDTVAWGDLGAVGEPVDVQPGSSWSDAPDISSGGSYAFHLGPGTVAVFRMPLDWGQHGQVLISSEAKVDEDDAVTTYWAAPQGGAVTRPKLQNMPPDASEFGLDLRDGPATQAMATPVVNWRDRELDTGVFGLDQSGMPGSYYFVVHLAKQGIPADGVDFTFQSGYFFDYAVRAPTYEPGASPIPEVATFEDDVDKPGSSSTDSDGGDVPWPVVLMLFGGGAIFGVVGVVALHRVRRSRP